MTKNEQELIDIIRSSDDHTKAMVIAIDIICQYLRQHESSTEPSAVALLGSAGIS